MKAKRKSQRRIPGIKRIPAPSSLHPMMEAKLTVIAERYGVSRSWVIATLLADKLKFTQQEAYYEAETKLRRVK